MNIRAVSQPSAVERISVDGAYSVTAIHTRGCLMPYRKKM